MFTDAERQSVFSYSWRGKSVFVDPLLMLRNLDLLAGGSLNDLLRKVNSPEYGIAEPATMRLAYAVCVAFKLGQPFNPETGQGIQYGEWIPVLNEFTDWLDAKKKQVPNSPTCAEPTGQESSVPPGFVSDTAIGSRSI
jgi:hypothetical protein